MVVQKTIDNLKERPHDEKKAVAGGIAIMVVIILIIGWGFLFLRKIQQGTMPSLEGSAVPEDQFNLNLIRDTERELSNMYNNSTEDLRTIRDNAAQNQTPGGQFDASGDTQAVTPDDTDQFGNSGGGF